MSYKKDHLLLRKAVQVVAKLDGCSAEDARRQLTDALQDGALLARSVDTDPHRGEIRRVIAPIAWSGGVDAAIEFQEGTDVFVTREDLERIWGPNATLVSGPPVVAQSLDVQALIARVRRLEDAARSDRRREQAARAFGLRPQPNHIRSGAEGRPTSAHLVIRELDRRMKAGEASAILSAEAAYLRGWLLRTYPDATPMTEKTIKNRIRTKFWHDRAERKPRPKKARNL